MGPCKFNTGSVLVLSALSLVFLAVTEKHVPRPVMIIHCLLLWNNCEGPVKLILKVYWY